MEYFDFVKKVNYEGEQSSNPFAFKFYDPDRVIFGKKMSEHLPFAMAWWHNLGAAGADVRRRYGRQVFRSDTRYDGTRKGKGGCRLRIYGEARY